MKNFIALALLLITVSCSDNGNENMIFDGRLETDIIKVNAQSPGELDSLLVDEGQLVKKGQLLAVIDSERLTLQKEQQLAQLSEIGNSYKALEAQSKQVKAQLKLNNDLIAKTKNLLDKGAATSQKLDELNTQNEVLSAQLEAINLQKSALLDKKQQLNAIIELSNLNINDTHLVAPVNGTIINRYFNQSELVNPGMPVFDVANLSIMEASVYVSLKQLAHIKLNQEVRVIVDGLEETLPGKVQWISSEAEFTPKTILTEETRTSLVYAVKIQVKNDDGKLKIGMPVQVKIEVI